MANPSTPPAANGVSSRSRPARPSGPVEERRARGTRPAADGAHRRKEPEHAPPAPANDPARFWNRLKRTDPRATKPFTRSGGFKGTQIDPTWRLQIMTEVFGPVGQGWGYEQLDWTISEGMVFICVRVWYRNPESGETFWTGPQWGGTEMKRRRRDGAEAPDDECFKMSITDALGKCLLQLGLGADIYMGQFDDSKYRKDSEAYFTAKDNPANQPEQIGRFEAEIAATLEEVSDPEGLDTLWRGGVRERLREIGLVDRDARARVLELFSKRKAELIGDRDADDERHAA